MADYKVIDDMDKDLILIINNKDYAMVNEICSKGGGEAIAKNFKKVLDNPKTEALKDLKELIGENAEFKFKIVKRGSAENLGLIRVDEETEDKIYEISCR